MVIHSYGYQGKNSERLILLSLMVFLCGVITFYSGYVLRITTVFSHFYYIPIILASVWWQRKGIPVVFILTLLLLMSYTLNPDHAVTTIDYVRVFVVFFVGIVIALLPQGKDTAPRSIISAIRYRLAMVFSKDRVRLVLVLALVTISCLLTVYFHAVLNRGAVFTHFFYAPIILSALWWRKKGLWIAFFLAGFLIFGHVWMRGYVITANDYFRALMFIAVPYVISTLGDKITVADKKAQDLNFIIGLIHEITRFVVVENNSKKLAESIAKTLVRSPECRFIAITLFGQNGLPDESIRMWGNGLSPRSGRRHDRAPECHDEPVPAGDVRIRQCEDCGECDTADNLQSLTYPLTLEGTNHGILTVVLARSDAHVNDTINLLKTIAGEFSYALHNIDANTRNKKMLEETVRMRTEELATTNARLLREIHEKNTLYADLEKSVRELENFVNTVTHDLKSPLFTMGLCTRRLEKNHGEVLGEKGREYLRQIEKNTVRMENLIRDVLVLSKVRIEFDNMEIISMENLLAELSDRLDMVMRENNVCFIVGKNLPEIRANRGQVIQVFENLITNAVKYRNIDITPCVEVGLKMISDGYCHFFIRDNGIGIDKKNHDKIFDEFYRTHDVDVEGSGIGLAIVKKIVEKHGGTVSVTSLQSEGSTFYFSFPAAPLTS
ncbi:MAG TPA: HAMP domain-containing sensor histidine kinase [Spirochaetota bacterium]|nr:HAMP domain-containing sensor histidine kinase [Spirochaetota bacterium]